MNSLTLALGCIALYLPIRWTNKKGILKKLPVWKGILLFLAGGAFMIAIAFVLSAVTSIFHIPLPETSSDAADNYNNLAYVLFLYFMSVGLAPMFEEAVCRWGLISLLEMLERRFGNDAIRHFAYGINIVLSAFVFGILHLPSGGFVQVVYASCSGILLGMLFLGKPKSYAVSKDSVTAEKNLLRDLLFHMGFNFVSITMAIAATAVSA